MELSLLIAVVLISIFGLPHGALDPIVAYRAGVWRKPRGLVFFLVGYIALCSSMIIFWGFFPVLGFSLFMILSAIHFGRDYQRYSESTLEQLSYGAFVLGIPVIFHPEQASIIFEFLLFGYAPKTLIILIQAFAIAGIIVLALNIKHHAKVALIELLSLLAVAWILNPLWYFVLFFCGLHSPRHIISSFRLLKPELKSLGLFVMFLITLITIGIGIGVGIFMKDNSLMIDALTLQILFVGLAGLTVPHMLLIERDRKRT